MPTAAIAKTSTPDAAAGNPVDVVTLNPGAGTADRQVVAIGDPTTGTNYAAVSAAGAISDNLAQLAGTTVDVNSGLKSAGTLRVVLATDQPALTNKLLVTPDSVALPANQSVNVAQFGTNNVVTGTGASGVGVPRVTVANDSVVLANQNTAAATAGAWPTKLTDGTNITAVKAASTAPLLTDPAAVVAISPNSYQYRLTYRAVYRLAARPYALSNAFGAAGRKQYATLHHTAGAAKKVRLRRVLIFLESSSAAGIVMADLAFITAAPATGNPAITPTPMNRGDAAAEAVALALPTTAGTEGALITTAEWDLGVTGAGSAVMPPPPLTPYELYSEDETSVVGDVKSVELRAATLEGVAVILDASAAITVKGYVIITFTEE